MYCECGRNISYVRVWPLHCSCGRLVGKEKAESNEAPKPKLPVVDTTNSNICRTQCDKYIKETGQCSIQEAKKKGKGYVSYLDTHPELSCPDNPPKFIGIKK